MPVDPPWAGREPLPPASPLWSLIGANPARSSDRFGGGGLYTINYQPGDPADARAQGWSEVYRPPAPRPVPHSDTEVTRG